MHSQTPSHKIGIREHQKSKNQNTHWHKAFLVSKVWGKAPHPKGCEVHSLLRAPLVTPFTARTRDYRSHVDNFIVTLRLPFTPIDKNTQKC